MWETYAGNKHLFILKKINKYLMHTHRPVSECTRVKAYDNVCVYERVEEIKKKKKDLTSLALRLLSSPSCSESLLDSLPPLCEDGVAACLLGRIQISTRAPSSPLPRPLTAGPLEPPSCSCLLRRSSCSA